MPSIRIREDESFESALYHFKRRCDRAGIVTEARKRAFYEKPTAARKRAKAAARKRLAMQLSYDRAQLRAR